MKTLLGLLIAIAAAPLMAAGIHFEKGSFKEALEKSAKEQKILFVDVYTQWCGPCKKMANTVFLEEDVGTLFNKHFVSYKLDAEDEDLNGPELAEKYEVQAFPTYLFIDGSGELVSKQSGAMSADTFMVMAMTASGLSDNTESPCKAFNEGDKSIKAFLRCHAQKTLDARELAKSKDYSGMMAVGEFYDAFYATQTPEQLLSKDGFRLISATAMLQRGSDPTEFLVAHYPQFKELVNPHQLASVAVEANKMGLMMSAFQQPESGEQWLKDIKGVLKDAYDLAHPSPNIAYEWERLEFDSLKHMTQKSWPEFLSANVAQSELLSSEADRQAYLDQIAAKLLLFKCDDDATLRKASVYAASAWDRNQNFQSVITYTQLVIQMGNKSKSRQLLTAAEKLIQSEPSAKRKAAMTAKLDEVKTLHAAL